jgi:hypothetical protein
MEDIIETVPEDGHGVHEGLELAVMHFITHVDPYLKAFEQVVDKQG